MVDRLCALADMPKPQVAIADTDIPNAFATGRSPKNSVVCVTTGILRRLDARGARGRPLPRALPRGAPRRGGHDGRRVPRRRGRPRHAVGSLLRRRPPRQRQRRARLAVHLARAASSSTSSRSCSPGCSAATASCAQTGPGAYLTGKPSALASALTKISGDMARIPTKDLREEQAFNAFMFAPAINGDSISGLFATHPPLGEAARAAREDLGRPLAAHRLTTWDSSRTSSGAATPRRPTSTTCSRCRRPPSPWRPAPASRRPA